MSKIDERLNEIAKNIDTAFYSTFDVNPDDDMCWLIDRCRKLEKVAEAARNVDKYFIENKDGFLTWEINKALKALGDENE